MIKWERYCPHANKICRDGNVFEDVVYKKIGTVNMKVPFKCIYWDDIVYGIMNGKHEGEQFHLNRCTFPKVVRLFPGVQE